MAIRNVPEIRVYPATIETAALFAPLIRKADVDEVSAASGLSIQKALEASIRMSTGPKYGTIDGELAAVWGVGFTSFVSGAGSPWLLGTDLMDKLPKAWLHISKEVVSDMKTRYSYLENYVDVRNKRSIRWLKWLGFEFDEPAPYGVSGLPFHRFSMRV